MDIFKNFFLGCCYSDNRPDIRGDLVTGPGPVEGGARWKEQPNDIYPELPLGGTVVPNEEVKRGPLLEIEVVEGVALKKGTLLTINAQGLIDSKRGKKDGCTIIGTQG